MLLYIIYLSNPYFKLLKTLIRKNITREKMRGLLGDLLEAYREYTSDLLG
jgi:hypothetical protein